MRATLIAAIAGVCFLSALFAAAAAEVEFEKHTLSTFRGGAQKVVTTDLDLDGDIDMLSGANGIRLWDNIGDRQFVEHVVDADIGTVIGIKTADIDGDGDIDIAAACYDAGAIIWWENTGDLVFVEHVVATGFVGAHDVDVYDIDQDGFLDLAGARGSTDGTGEICWWENDGHQAFTRHPVYSGFHTHCVVAKDVDLDGDVDIMGTQSAEGFRLWRNNGTERFSETLYPLPGVHHLIVEDIDQDGLPDMLVAVADVDTDNIIWWRNTTAGVFEATVIAESFSVALFLDTGDIDGDGDTDIVGSSFAGSDISWFENTDNHVFLEHSIAGFLRAASGVAVADIDGDGDLDVAGTAWRVTYEVSWWENLSEPPSLCEGDEEGDEPATAVALAGCGTTDASFDCAGDLDSFRFVASTPGTFVFETLGTMYTHMRLLDATGNEFDQGSGDEGNSRVSRTLDAGRVVFVEVGEASSATGSYQLSVSGCSGPGYEYGYLVSAIAKLTGAAGTNWSSDLVVLNIGETTATVVLSLWERDLDNSAPQQATLVLAPGELLKQDDVMLSLFGIPSGAGALHLLSDQPLVVASRTFNDTGTGTYGQLIPAVAVDGAVAGGGTVALAGIVEDADFRSNLGLVNPTATAITVSGSVLTADGFSLGDQDFVVPPFGYIQINQVLSTLPSDPSPVSGAWMTLSAPSGQFLSFLSVVDNHTGDPVFRSGEVPSAAAVNVLLAGLAKLEGAAGTNWLSDVVLLNTGANALTVELELWERDADNAAAQQLDYGFEAYQSVTLEDVMLDLFGQSEGAAALNVTAPAGLVTGCRTYNQVDPGTYGQAIPGLVAEQSFSADDRGYLVMVAEDTRFRSNLGLVNAGPDTVQVEARLHDGTGSQIAGVEIFSLPARGVTQINRIVRRFTTEDVSAGYLELRIANSAGGGVHAYLSVVDQLTGDPIFETVSVRAGN